ncbi:M48 family metalloprotease [Streptosporangium jomthongense]|uniref:M48 family metalloprotease n=1 Tax=Streptosporangium jomthongense TaxID=1193683 RepID=A0ABV8F409_9ACTN
MRGNGPTLPSTSVERLRLLFLTVAAGALFGGYWFLVLVQDGWSERNRACGALPGIEEFLDCSTRILVLQALVPLAGPALVAVLTVSAYLAAPTVITHRHGARPLDPWPRAIRETVERAGLDRTPTLMLSEQSGPLWMFVYGRRNRHRVMLSSDTPLCAVTDTERVTATLAHELGHLRNRDVDRTYLAVFAVVSLALVTIAPVGLSALLVTGPTPALAVTWRDLVLALLVTGTWAAVVRAREHDADLWGGDLRPGGMLALLTGGKQERRGLLRLHPPHERRLRVLLDPDLLLRPSAVEAVATGIAAGVVVTELGVSLRTLLPVPPLVAYWVAGLVAAVPVSGIVGLAVWRAGAARVLTRLQVLACGLGLGAGLVAGLVLAPRSGVRWSRWIPTAPDFTAVAEPTEIQPGTAIWMTVTLLALTTAVTGWLALAARAWAPRAGTRAWRYTAPLAALMLAVVLGTWSLAARLAASEQWGAADLARLMITPQAALFLLVLALVALLAPRLPLRTAAPLLVLVLVLPPSLLILSPAPPPPVTTRAAALPDSPQAGVICLGLFTVGVSGFGAPADHAAKARLGETLRDSDDGLLRQVGELFLRGARTRSQDLEGLAWTAFVRRCDHLRRYHDAPVPEPVSPFPTEGW